ncbi:MAG: hypothetical protein A2049_13145 [Elusimicrobia bacterium GWA2_62_23]|nr:MAG: hypothetical protein A2049_13145 [Elusimicrobia bacterium GWA2_62_23]
MPRNARLDIPGCLYHVINRGNERREIFVDNTDREDFIKRLRTALELTGTKCLAWCLMPNHFHMMILRGARPLAELMGRLLTGYVGNFNRRHSRCGHLFQNRYTSILCEEDAYLRELTAYIHLNPLRAGLLRSYEDLKNYKWCGHGEVTGTRHAGLADRDYLLQYFGRTNGEAEANYDEFVEERKYKYKAGELSGGSLFHSFNGTSRVLAAGRRGERELSDSRVLGSSRFVEILLKHAQNTPCPRESAGAILERVCAKTGVTAAEIKSASRIRGIVAARARYCYLAKEAGIGGGILAKELNRNSGAISYLTGKGRVLEASN